MIETRESLVGEISGRQSLSGSLNCGVVHIEPIVQEKSAIPLMEAQEITPDNGYTGLSKVTVGAIPSEYIIPSGELDITKNGTYDVTDKASAKVNVPEKQLGTKTITTNGTYNASDDNLDGYSQVEVATSGVDINEYLSDTITRGEYEVGGWIKTIKKIRSPLTIEGTDATYMFHRYLLNELPQIDTSNVTNMDSMFNGCNSLTSVPQLDTSKVTNMGYMFINCRSLATIPNFDMSKVNMISNAFNRCTKLTNVGRFENLGNNYSTNQSANYYNYGLNLSACTNLTYDSLMNIINNLYDIKSKGVKNQRLQLGDTNKAKLTEEEIAIATNKGWSVS